MLFLNHNIKTGGRLADRKQPQARQKKITTRKSGLTGKDKKTSTSRSIKVASTAAFSIVGVGASAGGLEAFLELFRTMPTDTGLAFVLVQHLSPVHTSMLTTLIQKSTKLFVQEVTDGVTVESNHIYIIPPNAMLEIFHGVLHLSPMTEPHSACMSVNVFLKSLAIDQGNLATGVILSGTGSDGAEGLRDIKADGGITFVQKPSDAKYDGMPKAAIATSPPDYILAAVDIAKELALLAKTSLNKKTLPLETSEPSPEMAPILAKIFILIRRATKIDFSTYKFPTISRRIKRRMVLHKIGSLKNYLDYLQETPKEIHALFEDLLINVTDFFRDPEVFESMKSKIFPVIMNGRSSRTPIRIWIPGCSTGEEVYSVAIALLEYLGESASKYPIQIYGTDICEPALKIARSGIYPESASINLSKDRLERFFRKDANGYRISKGVRDCCIFSVQDVTSQPPINRLDLLSCRNLLIYLGLGVQKKLMETFSYALNSNGFLVLGTAEGVGASAHLFSTLDKKHKIYQKKSSTSGPRIDYHPVTAYAPPASPLSHPPAASLTKATDPVYLAERKILDSFASAWVLVNPALEIIQFRGVVAPYIEPASGQPSWNLMKMIRPELSSDVRILIHSVLKDRVDQRKRAVKFTSNGRQHLVDIDVSLIPSPTTEAHCLILFHEHSVVENSKPEDFKSVKKLGPKEIKLLIGENKILRAELGACQKSLQSVIEDQNATNEEMQSANEEVMSANEELQSTNEELETAKEELQSTNEELTTLNDELSGRNHELDYISNDLVNLLGNANVSIVMIGLDFKIRRFTPMAEKLLNLIAADIGRSLTHINLGFKIDKIEEKITEVTKHFSTLEIESQDTDGHWYAIRIKPYRTLDNKIDGAVLVFINIDEIKARERIAHDAENFSDGIIQTVRDPLLLLTADMKVERANQAFYDIFKVREKETLGNSFFELSNRQWDNPELRNLLENVLPKKTEIRDFRVSQRFEAVGRRRLSCMPELFSGMEKRNFSS